MRAVRKASEPATTPTFTPAPEPVYEGFLNNFLGEEDINPKIAQQSRVTLLIARVAFQILGAVELFGIYENRSDDVVVLVQRLTHQP